MHAFPVAVQPYTIRSALATNYVDALERLASIGYKGIELGLPPDGMSITEQKAVLDRLGLHVIGTHAGFDTLDFDADRLADYLDQIEGGRYVTISLRLHSREDILAKAVRMNEIGKQFRDRGITFLYHNHDWEFTRFDGEYALDLLLNATDPELVKTELDTYWIKRGGEDPVTYLQTLSGRAPLLHIKDMEAGDEQLFAEIGTGILNFRAIAQVAQQIGVECLVVEQDECRQDPFESLQISYTNLRELGIML
ncbi:MAG: sugar phosphate isomerase/epimerase [Firmicutes bacterium]|nr:sugar phosphate isomerase/epimerase [Bacillota bacterium]